MEKVCDRGIPNCVMSHVRYKNVHKVHRNRKNEIIVVECPKDCEIQGHRPNPGRRTPEKRHIAGGSRETYASN